MRHSPTAKLIFNTLNILVEKVLPYSPSADKIQMAAIYHLKLNEALSDKNISHYRDAFKSDDRFEHQGMEFYRKKSEQKLKQLQELKDKFFEISKDSNSPKIVIDCKLDKLREDTFKLLKSMRDLAIKAEIQTYPELREVTKEKLDSVDVACKSMMKDFKRANANIEIQTSDL